MKVIIDRVLKEYVVVELEGGEVVKVDEKLFPNAHEGEVYDISLDENETRNRKELMTNLVNKVFED